MPPRHRRPMLTHLEPRDVPAILQPAGDETLANVTTQGFQGRPAVAAFTGGSVVVWHSEGDAATGTDVFGRLFDAAGLPIGGEFRVNASTAGNQAFAKVAAHASGDFVVSWHGPDGDSYGVYARRFNAAGQPQGGEFLVNQYTTSSQAYSAVAIDADGDFTVAWQSNGQDGSGYGIYARRYSSAGVAQGDEFRVNPVTEFNQRRPSVASDAAGNVVIAWNSRSEDGSGYGVYARRYSAAGAPTWAGRANQTTFDNQYFGEVASDANGGFMIAWAGYGPGDDLGVYARRFNADGSPRGDEFRVNATTAGNQTLSAVAVAADGDAVIVWQSEGQDGSANGIFARRYSPTGSARGGEFRVNTTTTGEQAYAAVSRDAAGNTVFVWESLGQDGSGPGVIARRYTMTAGAPTFVLFEGGFLWRRDGAVWSAVSSNVAAVADPVIDADGRAVTLISFANGFVWEYSEDGDWTSLASGVQVAAAGQSSTYMAFAAGGLWRRDRANGSWTAVSGATVTGLSVGRDATGQDLVGVIFQGNFAWTYRPAVGQWTALSATVASLSVGPAGEVAVLFQGGFLWQYQQSTGAWQSLTSNVSAVTAGSAANGGRQFNIRFNDASAWTFTDAGWAVMTTGVQRLSRARGGVTDVVFTGGFQWQVGPNSGQWTSIAAGVV